MNLRPLCPDCRQPMEPTTSDALQFICEAMWRDFGRTDLGALYRLPGATHRALRVWREGELTVWTTKGG